MTKPDAMAARKKDKEENETLDDLEHNEDGRGCCYQPLLKTYPEAADRSPSSIANVLRDLMRGGQQELRTGIASHFSPGLAALPHFQTIIKSRKCSTIDEMFRFVRHTDVETSVCF